jgi:hypothetical protein
MLARVCTPSSLSEKEGEREMKNMVIECFKLLLTMAALKGMTVPFHLLVI